MFLFRNKLYLANTLGHFTVDVFASMSTVMVALFNIPNPNKAALLPSRHQKGMAAANSCSLDKKFMG